MNKRQQALSHRYDMVPYVCAYVQFQYRIAAEHRDTIGKIVWGAAKTRLQEGDVNLDNVWRYACAAGAEDAVLSLTLSPYLLDNLQDLHAVLRRLDVARSARELELMQCTCRYLDAAQAYTECPACEAHKLLAEADARLLSDP